MFENVELKIAFILSSIKFSLQYFVIFAFVTNLKIKIGK